VDWYAKIKELDEIRFDFPRQALAEVDALLGRDCPLDAEARLLGVSGSALRTLVRLGEAKADLGEGLQIAKLLGAIAIQGELVQKLAYVVSDEKRPGLALGLVAEAMGLHESFGNSLGVARCLVDRGRLLFKTDKYSLAVVTLKRSLELLPESEQKNRFTSHQFLALCFVEQGLLAEAQAETTIALDLAIQLPDRNALASIFWTDGRLEFALDRPHAAIDSYGKALDYYIDDHHTQAAVCGVELVAAQFLAGEDQAALNSARRLIHVAGRLSGNPLVCEALQALIMCKELSKRRIRAVWNAILRELDPSSRKWQSVARRVFSR
jgi:tetratricopeptide (TPR) repeat protein